MGFHNLRPIGLTQRVEAPISRNPYAFAPLRLCVDSVAFPSSSSCPIGYPEWGFIIYVRSDSLSGWRRRSAETLTPLHPCAFALILLRFHHRPRVPSVTPNGVS